MKQINLFRGAEHDCSYLTGLAAQSAYVDPHLRLDVALYSRLVEQGFRRSGNLVYRPHCTACSACVPVRIAVARFAPDRSQRRNGLANKDLTVTVKPAEFAEDQFQLFRRYLTARHEDGGMADSRRDEFIGFLGSEWAETWFVEFRLAEKLLAVAVVDRLDSGLSAVYTYFDPAQSARGLGTFAVLWQINEARRLGLKWLYLGFWIKNSQKMRYKERFRPIEAYLFGQWHSFEKGANIQA